MDEMTKSGLGVALNEASLLGVDVSRSRRMAAVTLSVLSLPPDDVPPTDDTRVSIVLENVGRVAASLRNAHWSDPSAQPVPFTLDDLLAVSQSFGQLPIYGWEFIDRTDDFNSWSHRLSLDERLGDGGMAHSLTLFQEGGDRHLDLIIWFDTLHVFDPQRRPIDIQQFIADGVRWWTRFNQGDLRTNGRGPILPQDFNVPPGS